jgi:hypothetical protein
MYKKLNEASIENIRVIKQLTNAIWSSLPDVPEGTVKDVYLSRLSGFNRIYNMYNDNEKFIKPFSIMETTKLRIVNDPNYKDPYYSTARGIWGYHSSNDNLLLVWMSNIRAHTKGHQLDTHLRSTLAHEIRHLFQNALYPKYFNSTQAFKKSYESQQIEIDAVWSQLLSSEIDVENYNGHPADFIEEVMGQLMSRKKLSDKEIQHYSRKTMKYYRQFFDENTETEWRRLIATWGKEVQKHSNYTVDDFLNDVVTELDDYLEYKINNPKIKQQVLNYYAAETRKAYKQLSAAPRQERKKSSVIEKLMPLWQDLVEHYRDEWFDPNISSVKLTAQILSNMSNSMDQAAGNNYELRSKLAAWFGNMTRERIAAARSWHTVGTPENSR